MSRQGLDMHIAALVSLSFMANILGYGVGWSSMRSIISQDSRQVAHAYFALEYRPSIFTPYASMMMSQSNRNPCMLDMLISTLFKLRDR